MSSLFAEVGRDRRKGEGQTDRGHEPRRKEVGGRHRLLQGGLVGGLHQRCLRGERSLCSGVALGEHSVEAVEALLQDGIRRRVNQPLPDRPSQTFRLI